MTAQELARRLITLIFAGRNRRDMIRRELPRTRGAGWVLKPFRIGLREGSPFRGPSAVIGAAVQKDFTMLRCLRQFSPCFGMDGDGPHKAEQFTAERRHDLILVFAASRQRDEPFVQPLLRFPGDPLGFFAEP
jgi:hypothetical protein